MATRPTLPNVSVSASAERGEKSESAKGLKAESEGEMKTRMQDKIMWWFIGLLFVGWIVGVYLKSHGLWKGF